MMINRMSTKCNHGSLTKQPIEADISQRHRLFPYEMASEEREQKFYADDASVASSGRFFWGMI